MWCMAEEAASEAPQGTFLQLHTARIKDFELATDRVGAWPRDVWPERREEISRRFDRVHGICENGTEAICAALPVQVLQDPWKQ